MPKLALISDDDAGRRCVSRLPSMASGFERYNQRHFDLPPTQETREEKGKLLD